MSKKKPTHRDAQLILELYDLRRESVMRQSRNAIAQWVPKSWDEFFAITQPTHELNAAWRQVSSYYEMAFGFARHGILHAELLGENSGEGLLLFAKVKPYLERFRKEVSPYAFRNVQWLVEHSEEARRRFKLMQERVSKLRDAK